MTLKIKSTKTISAENTFSDWVSLAGMFAFTLTGIADSTVTVQASPDAGTTKIQMDEFTVDDADADGHIYETGVGISGYVYRWGVKTGDYGSDTLVGTLAK